MPFHHNRLENYCSVILGLYPSIFPVCVSGSWAEEILGVEYDGIFVIEKNGGFDFVEIVVSASQIRKNHALISFNLAKTLFSDGLCCRISSKNKQKAQPEQSGCAFLSFLD
ncbi:MAG: hypothetical protein Q4D82_02505 [Neisseria sp.]|nr:hypothetical protein [Neisseria sp.]